MQHNSNSMGDTFGWRLVELACLALSAVVPEFISPTQALLAALSIELLRGHSATTRHILMLYAITFALQILRADSSWWHAAILCGTAIILLPLSERHPKLRTAGLYYLCMTAIFAIISATGLQEGLPSINLFATFGVNPALSEQTVLFGDQVSAALANTCLPLPHSFAPYPLDASNDVHQQALFVFAILIALAVVATRRNSIKITSNIIFLAAYCFVHFSPPTTAQIWTTSATGGWAVLDIQSDGGVVVREAGADELLPAANLAVVERHHLGAPVDKGSAQWISMLELWSLARCDDVAEHKSLHNRYLGSIRYSVDTNGYLVIVPLP
jgi:hypothetical protein